MSRRRIKADILDAIERFVGCELPLADLCHMVRDEVGPALNHNEKLPFVNLNSVCPEPTFRIRRWHVENALAKRREKTISERDLVNWATMLMINDAFFWKGEDAEAVGRVGGASPLGPDAGRLTSPPEIGALVRGSLLSQVETDQGANRSPRQLHGG
jgi:hypothetical protein